MALVMTRIEPPSWAPPYAQHVVKTSRPDGERARQVASHLRDAIERELHRRVSEFVNDLQQCFVDESSGFPVRGRLAGTYYIGSESYEGVEQSQDYPWRVWIEVRCLEIPWHPNQQTEGYDYLGLEAIVNIAADGSGFAFDDGFNTSVI